MDAGDVSSEKVLLSIWISIIPESMTITGALRAAIFGLIRKTGTQNQVLDNFAKITKGCETLQKGKGGGIKLCGN